MSTVTLLFAILLWVFVPSSTDAEQITNSVGMRLQLIESGRFEMGEHDLAPGFYEDHSSFNTDNDERPVHPVVITRPFYLATTEVTVGQFREFVEATNYVTSAEQADTGAVGWDPKPPQDRPGYVATFREDSAFHWKNPGFTQDDGHPVTCVSHVDAVAYCRWLSEKEGSTYRLPTEAEWEYAARAGTESYFSFGDEYRGVIQRHANLGNAELERAFPDRVRRQWLIDIESDPPDQHVFTAPAGSYEPNPWHLHDMYGNVWEWCEDRYLDTSYTPYTRPGHQQVRKRASDPLVTKRSSDVGDWRVIRGGSWFNAPIQCRSGVRGYFEAGDAACYVGFRVARVAPEEIVADARQRFEQSEEARSTIGRIVGENNVRERRDGRLTLQMRHQHLSAELFTALSQLDEPVDIHLHGDNRLSPDDLAGLARTRHLAGLMLSGIGSNVTESDFAFLARHPRLELLEITGNVAFTDRLFEPLEQHGRLEQLILEGNGITDAGLMRLPTLDRLEILRLDRTSAEGECLERFQHSPLRTFSCKHLTDGAARHLAHFPELREVSLTGSPITGTGLEVIGQLPWVNQLTLNGCLELQDTDFAVLGNLYELSNVSLVETAAGDRAARALAGLNNLRDVHLGSDNLSDAGLRQICSIVSLNHLTLAKEATKITDAGLTDLWRLVNLRGFNLEAPLVTGSGFATLHELPRLERMNLGGASIADPALKHAARSESLRHLFLGSWNGPGPADVTDAGVLHLADSPGLTSLDIRLGQTKASEAAVDQLREQKPQLRVSIR